MAAARFYCLHTGRLTETANAERSSGAFVPNSIRARRRGGASCKRPKHSGAPSLSLVSPRLLAKRSLLCNSIPVSGPGDASGNSGGSDGQVTQALMESMRSKISEALETEQVSLVDVYGDGRHVSIDVVSEAFEGKSSMERQRMVYKAIWFELQDTVHAVDSMSTKTPQEAGSD
mmetsp:Transcript_10924/g.25951  ORF Transcript_10924/g.25951 Transcript_10924/m.25951 type:complete len:174 (+) Transcript_10924:92-613(+)